MKRKKSSQSPGVTRPTVSLYAPMSCGWWMTFCHSPPLYKSLDSLFMDRCGVDRKTYRWHISKVTGTEDSSLLSCGNNHLRLGAEENIVCPVVEVPSRWVSSYAVHMEDGHFPVCFPRRCKNPDRAFSSRKRHCLASVRLDNIGLRVAWWDGELFDGHDR